MHFESCIVNISITYLKTETNTIYLPGDLHGECVDQIVVHVGESDAIFGAHGRSDDHFVDVVELIPIFISASKHIVERYESLLIKTYCAF